MLLTACSDAANRTSSPDISNNDLPINVPQDLSVSTNDGVVTLTWSDVLVENNNQVLSYNIYWNEISSVSKSDLKEENISSPYVMKGLTEGITYYFTVSTNSALGESDISFEITAMAPQPIILSILLTPADNTITSGNTQQFKATAILSDDSELDLTSAVIWHSTDNNIVALIMS